MHNADGLTDRDAAIDALTRFAIALDDNDRDLLAGSLTENMVMDLTPFQKVGMNYSTTEGREVVTNQLIKAVGPLDSTHHLSNFRVKVTGDKADLSCYVLAQHFRNSQGASSEFQDSYLMGNRYSATVVRAGDVWKIENLVIHPAWTQGVLDVMKV